MATSKEFVSYVMEQLSGLEDARNRAMMGEYVLYYKDKVIGGMYDNRLLLKPVPAALELLPGGRLELPYDGAKEMLLIEDLENRELLEKLFRSMYDQLPATKKRTKKS